jgi:hypothetical protein
MTKTASKIRFKAKLFRPAESAKAGSWMFLTLPKNASAKLPSRGMTAIEGTINGKPFQATLEPDGQKSHWLKGGPEAERSCWRRRRRRCHPRDRAGGRGTGINGAGRFAQGSRERRPGRAGVVVGHHAHRAQRLDPLDHLRQARRDAHAPDQKCLLDARRREAPRLLLRPVWVLQ